MLVMRGSWLTADMPQWDERTGSYGEEDMEFMVPLLSSSDKGAAL